MEKDNQTPFYTSFLAICLTTQSLTRYCDGSYFLNIKA